MSTNLQLRFNLIWIIIPIAVIAILVFKPFSCGSQRSNFSLSKYTALLEGLDYTPADITDEPILPDTTIPPELVTATTTGSGYWVPESDYASGDSLDVDVSVVVLEDESAWVKVTIDSTEVKWHKLEHYDRPQKPIVRNWTAFVEYTNIGNNHTRFGIGVGYRIWRPFEINVSPAVSVSTNLDWIAGEFRLSRNIWSGVAIGGGCGYRIGADDGLHLSIGLSLEL